MTRYLPASPSPGALIGIAAAWRSDPRLTRELVVGILMIAAVVLFIAVGSILVDPNDARVASAPKTLPPSAEHPLGTDATGRDLWTVLVLATPSTLKVGLIAGSVGIAIGLVLGLASGFIRGTTDRVIRTLSDALLTVPGIAILIVIASNVDQMTLEMFAVSVAALSWMFPTRLIRAQVLSIREQSFIEVARANGVGVPGIILVEILPNLMPFIVAAFVGAVSGAMLLTVGLETLGLGVEQSYTLGVTISWALEYSAILRGFWWWWLPPILMISFIFLALFVMSVGMDRFANPRLRRSYAVGAWRPRG